ncbi:MAG: hypothetical protein P8130_08160 [Deltaproteobacteria bacterium]
MEKFFLFYSRGLTNFLEKSFWFRNKSKEFRYLLVFFLLTEPLLNPGYKYFTVEHNRPLLSLEMPLKLFGIRHGHELQVGFSSIALS